MLPKSVSLWTIKDPSLTCAWNAFHLNKIIINVKYLSSVGCSSGQDRCRALMERPDTCHVPSQTTSGREKNKNKFSISSNIIKKYLSCLNQDRAEEKQKLLHRSRNHQILSNKYLTSVMSRLKQHQTGEEKNNMMIKSVHLGVPLCGNHSRNNFFPTLPFFKFEINRNTKSPLLDLISSDR